LAYGYAFGALIQERPTGGGKNAMTCSIFATRPGAAVTGTTLALRLSAAGAGCTPCTVDCARSTSAGGNDIRAQPLSNA
jgi:hypothetical protein